MADVATFGTLSVNGAVVLCNGKDLRLTQYEELVLAELVRGQDGNSLGRSSRVSLQDAIAQGSKQELPPLSNSLEVLISRLRKKLRAADANIEIRSLRGRGYCLLAPTGESA